VSSTETPGGSGIPAGWYDDPSGQGLRWWDGEAWTEHIHAAEPAADEAGGGEREAPPPELVKVRESIRGRGAKGVGIVLGAIVLVIVVIALLVSGGSDNGGGRSGGQVPAATKTAERAEIKAIDKQLKNKKLPKQARKQLQAEKKKLEKSAGGGSSGTKNDSAGNGKSGKKKTPGEEGN
jgi:hypothetical protein